MRNGRAHERSVYLRRTGRDKTPRVAGHVAHTAVISLYGTNCILPAPPTPAPNQSILAGMLPNSSIKLFFFLNYYYIIINNPSSHLHADVLESTEQFRSHSRTLLQLSPNPQKSMETCAKRYTETNKPAKQRNRGVLRAPWREITPPPITFGNPGLPPTLLMLAELNEMSFFQLSVQDSAAAPFPTEAPEMLFCRLKKLLLPFVFFLLFFVNCTSGPPH